jgi:hypothetical protein
MWLHIFRLQIHISAWANKKPEFYGFPQFLQAHAKGLYKTGPQLLTFTSFGCIIETIVIPTSSSRIAYCHDCQSKLAYRA